ncbi:MAG: hypothetical protein GAK33_01106 [Burkholderia lata]|uniref:Uncharacterized protein n=1 Tax=Burkholderia lata (strain ATCC 17760 / DSM 23089 / LMG 22485 / NCIMB 9086 / R18194 / 383) TaxID=482957 RepID=A0A833V3L4_BURL3|nr:MAG: hypothetical protein GAK33_01106 [Burkholderia lata]
MRKAPVARVSEAWGHGKDRDTACVNLNLNLNRLFDCVDQAVCAFGADYASG